MGLFQHKWDLNKDRLRIEFDLNSKRYVTFYGKDRVPYDYLNRKSKKELDEKNQQLMMNSDLLNQEIRRAKLLLRAEKLKSLGYTSDSFEYLGEVCGTMSKEMEVFLNNLTSEEDVLLGIHRLGSNVSSEKIEDILTNGLLITGHFGGAVNCGRTLGDNVGYYVDNRKIIKELMYADNYKNSKGSILVRIPDQDLTGNIFVTDEEDNVRLNPKYILGYVPLEKNHHIEQIVQMKPEMKTTVHETKSLNYELTQMLDDVNDISYDNHESLGKSK